MVVEYKKELKLSIEEVFQLVDNVKVWEGGKGWDKNPTWLDERAHYVYGGNINGLMIKLFKKGILFRHYIIEIVDPIGNLIDFHDSYDEICSDHKKMKEYYKKIGKNRYEEDKKRSERCYQHEIERRMEGIKDARSLLEKLSPKPQQRNHD